MTFSLFASSPHSSEQISTLHRDFLFPLSTLPRCMTASASGCSEYLQNRIICAIISSPLFTFIFFLCVLLAPVHQRERFNVNLIASLDSYTNFSFSLWTKNWFTKTKKQLKLLLSRWISSRRVVGLRHQKVSREWIYSSWQTFILVNFRNFFKRVLVSLTTGEREKGMRDLEAKVGERVDREHFFESGKFLSHFLSHFSWLPFNLKLQRQRFFFKFNYHLSHGLVQLSLGRLHFLLREFISFLSARSSNSNPLSVLMCRVWFFVRKYYILFARMDCSLVRR